MTATEPTHRRGKAVDDKILHAVIEEISAGGTLNVRVDAVAARAGVNKTTIYRRYPERDELVLAAVLELAEVVLPIPDTGVLRQDLTQLARMVGETVTSPLGQALLSASADSPHFVALRERYWRTRFDAASVIIERAIERGECRPGVDPSLLIELMVAPIHFRATQTGAGVTNTFVDHQVARLLDAVAP